MVKPSDVTIGLDAGHGLPDPGAVKFVKEYQIAMQLVMLTKQFLEEQGVKVLLTRTSDKSLSSLANYSKNKGEDIEKRIKLINKTDYTVSFHMNAGGGTGYETICYRSNDPKVIGFHKEVAKFFTDNGFRDRGIKTSKQSHQGGVGVIDRTNPVVVLGEFGFVDTQKDADAMANADFQKRLAKVIAKAAMAQVGLTYVEKTPVKEDVKPVAPKPPVTAPSNNPYAGKKLKSKVNGLNFYSKASWDAKDRVGTVDKGFGFPTIVEKVKIGGAEQYKVKNSKGAIFYITASSVYVEVVAK